VRRNIAITILGLSWLSSTATRPAVADEKAPAPPGALIRSARGGPWSASWTWEGGKVPSEGDRVQVRDGHEVVYDVSSDRVIRSVHVAGALRFDPGCDTLLVVGLIKIQPGDVASEDGFDCDAHGPRMAGHGPRPSLEVGTADRPVAAGHTATIRLSYVAGMDRETCPAIVCCGGRMDFHGAPMARTWVKLGRPARAGDASVTLDEEVPGWRVGDRIIVTATQRPRRERGTFRVGRGKDSMPIFTEERTIRAIVGPEVALDRPLDLDHYAEGDFRGEVADLGRSVVVESAAPDGVRGHTMYHRGSSGSISYAEFRHLGKEGIKGKYSLHFHQVGDTMRGSSVVGASIWDSANRWITIHGTNYLVVRDCVGYKSVGHGFFLEDGTEVDNVLDRNLAVQAMAGRPLPEPFLPFDNNSGAGFWWANSRNTFTRNVAVECDRYGFRFEATPLSTTETELKVEQPEDTPETFDLRHSVRQPDGSRQNVDIRTLPFVRFEGNEAHSQLYGINLGEGVRGVGPDARHPFILRNTRLWNNFWAFRPASPSVLVDRMDIFNGRYGVYRPVYDQHAYRNLTIRGVDIAEDFVRGDRPEGLDLPPRPKTIPGPFKPSLNPLDPAPGRPNVSATTKDFPAPLEPVDDLPPTTVITHVSRTPSGGLSVRGTAADNGTVRRVTVNGQTARAVSPNFAEWEVVLDGSGPDLRELSASAEDEAGNAEPRPHVVPVASR
jgi:hypothetical protein